MLANYSLHYVGGVSCARCLPSYFAMKPFAHRMQTLLEADASFVGIMSNGTSGNINNVNFGKAGPGKKEEGEQARLVAESGGRRGVCRVQRNVKHQDWAPIKMAQKEIELGVRLPDANEVERAEKIIAEAKGVLKSQPQVYARETVLMAKFPPKVNVILQAIRIGDLGVVANPCETFVEIGLEIKKNSPLKHTFTIELANGYNAYLPTPEHHALGGYETWRAMTELPSKVNASRAIVSTWMDLLKEVAK